MKNNTKYTKVDAIIMAHDFVKGIKELEERLGLSLNSDTGDVYLSFKLKNSKEVWGFN